MNQRIWITEKSISASHLLIRPKSPSRDPHPKNNYIIYEWKVGAFEKTPNNTINAHQINNKSKNNFEF